jgi:hypothetical protein
MSYWFNVSPKVTEHLSYERNVTWNVSTMLKRAGFHPRLVDGLTAVNLRPVVSNAVCVMEDNRIYFEKFNPENGWGSYENVLDFLIELGLYLHEAPDEYVMRVT